MGDTEKALYWRWADIRHYSPTFAAAFSRKSDPSRMYLRKVARERWPVWAMMARSGTPAAAAAVARPV